MKIYGIIFPKWQNPKFSAELNVNIFKTRLVLFYYFRKKLYHNPTYSVHRGEANRTRWKLPESGMVFISLAGPPGWCKKITSYLGIRSHYSPNQIWGVITVIALLCSVFVLITLFSPARDRCCLAPDSSHFRVWRLKFIPAALPGWARLCGISRALQGLSLQLLNPEICFPGLQGCSRA